MKRIQTLLIAALALVAIPVAIVSWFNPTTPALVAYDETDTLGARIPIVIALYSDSLASRISNTATSFTLVRGTDKQSRSLSGYYGFVIDEGATSEEFFTATCVATACTVVARGIDVVDGETEVTALKFEHRRGATVKMTDYPVLTYLARVVNGQESASSTFMFGDGSTTTTLFKTLKADNGTANLPFLRYNESLAQWQFSDNGLDTITFVTSSAGGLSASTTGATFITDSKVGVYTSSTASANGGYVGIKSQADGTYRIYFDSQTFLATVQNFANVQGTSTAMRLNFTPTSTLDATNRGYVDNAIVNGTTTGTAGMTITAGNAIYISSTSTLWQTNSSVASSTYQFVGIAQNTVSVGGEVKFTAPGQTICNQSGLSAGYTYYLNGTAGQIAVTPGTFHASIGRAVSASCIAVSFPKFIRKGVTTNASTNSSFIETGFYPAHIQIVAGMQDPGAAAHSLSIGDDTNNCIFIEGAAENRAQNSNTLAWCLYKNGSGALTGTIAKSATGFTVTGVTNGTGVTVALQWVAWSE